jgi:hypothetical protein
MKSLNEDEIADVLRIMMPGEDDPAGYEWELLVCQFATDLGVDKEKFLAKCKK